MMIIIASSFFELDQVCIGHVLVVVLLGSCRSPWKKYQIVMLHFAVQIQAALWYNKKITFQIFIQKYFHIIVYLKITLLFKHVLTNDLWLHNNNLINLT